MSAYKEAVKVMLEPIQKLSRNFQNGAYDPKQTLPIPESGPSEAPVQNKALIRRLGLNRTPWQHLSVGSMQATTTGRTAYPSNARSRIDEPAG